MAINQNFGYTTKEIKFEPKQTTTCLLRMYNQVLFMNIPPTFPEYHLLKPSMPCYFYEKDARLYFTLHKPESGYFITRKIQPHGTNGIYYKTCFPRQLKEKWARKRDEDTVFPEYIPCFYLHEVKEGLYACIYLP